MLIAFFFPLTTQLYKYNRRPKEANSISTNKLKKKIKPRYRLEKIDVSLASSFGTPYLKP